MIATCYQAQLAAGSWAELKCPYTVPAALRPRNEIIVPANCQNGGSSTTGLVVKTDGTITMQNLGSAGSTNLRSGTAIWIPGV